MVKASFIYQERDAIRRELEYTVADLQRDLKVNSAEYTEPGTDEPSIDVRLCIDEDGWIIRTGLVDFDPYHSEICAASSVGLDTDVDSLLEDLISDALDQVSE